MSSQQQKVNKEVLTIPGEEVTQTTKLDLRSIIHNIGETEEDVTNRITAGYLKW